MAATAQQVTDQLVALSQKVNDLEGQLQAQFPSDTSALDTTPYESSDAAAESN